MIKNILLVSQKKNSTWSTSIAQVAKGFGQLHRSFPQSAIRRVRKLQFDLIIIDSQEIENLPSLILAIRSHLPSAPIIVVLLSRRWRLARSILQSGATDCILQTTGNEKLKEIFSRHLNKTKLVELNPVKEILSKHTILFVDNNPDFLQTRGESLEQAGYTVLTALTPDEAKRKFDVGGIDLAIIDLRLENDDNDKDLSGLILAKRSNSNVPKIILTNFPTFEYVREALRPQLDGQAAAIDFVAKDEGPLILLESVQDILETATRQKENKRYDPNIFIGHGHDWKTRDKVSKLLTEMGVSPIILFNEANRGDTIIEKLERCCQTADFAIVIMTPDDLGYPKGKPHEIKPRARQNVIFELGYLVARLGRKRVRVLYKDVEIPTNFLGVLYIEMDNEEKWKQYLSRELKDVGIPIKTIRGV